MLRANSVAMDSTSAASGVSKFWNYRVGPAVGGAVIASLVPVVIIGGLAVLTDGRADPPIGFVFPLVWYPSVTIGAPIGASFGLWIKNHFPAEHLFPLIGIGASEMLAYHFLYGKRQLKVEGEGFRRANVGATLMGFLVVPLSQILYLELIHISTERDSTDTDAFLHFRENRFSIGMPQFEARLLPVPARNGMREGAVHIQLIKIQF
jgi:hypothetical protein